MQQPRPTSPPERQPDDYYRDYYYHHHHHAPPHRPSAAEDYYAAVPSIDGGMASATYPRAHHGGGPTPVHTTPRSFSNHPTAFARSHASAAGGSKAGGSSISQLISQYNHQPQPPTATTPTAPRSRYMRQRQSPSPSAPQSARSSQALSGIDALKENEFGPRYQHRSSYALQNPGASRRTSEQYRMQASQMPRDRHRPDANAHRAYQAPDSAQRVPLFGEVVAPEHAQMDAGYGILTTEHRRKSDGSMKHPEFRHSQSRSSQSHDLLAPPTNGLGPQHRSSSAHGHRKSRSDLSGMGWDSQEIKFIDTSPLSGPSPADAFPTPRDGPRQNHASHASPRSRIPVATRRLSNTSDSSSSASRKGSLDQSARSTRGPSRLGKSSPYSSSNEGRSGTPSSHRSGIPVRKLDLNSSSQKVNAYIAATQSAQKSPPLRSSRPRQPVSAASTAASRNKVVDRFKPHADEAQKKSAAPRPKPKELRGMDFAARRAMINKSVKVKDDERLEQLRKRAVAAVRSSEFKKPAEPHPAESPEASPLDTKPREGSNGMSATLNSLDDLPPIPRIPDQISPVVREHVTMESPVVGRNDPFNGNFDSNSLFANQRPGPSTLSTSSTPRTVGTEFAEEDQQPSHNEEASIHIMLAQSPQSAGNQYSRALSDVASTVRPEDSISMVGAGQTSRLPMGEWTPNLDAVADQPAPSGASDSYSAIHRVLDYYHSGADLSPMITSQLKQQVQAVTPQTTFDQWEDRAATSTYLRELLEGIQPSEVGSRDVRYNSTSETNTHRSSYPGYESDPDDYEGYGGTAIIYGQSARYSYSSRGGESDMSGAPDQELPRSSEDLKLQPAPLVPRNAASQSRDASGPQYQGGVQLPEMQGFGDGLGLSIHDSAGPFGQPPAPPPSHSPPPPPATVPLEGRFPPQGPAPSAEPSVYDPYPPSSVAPAAPMPPGAASRQNSYSVTLVDTPIPHSAPPSGAGSSTNLAHDISQTTSQTTLVDGDPEEAKRLLKRKHLIKELLDTEVSFHQDMKVVEDIYKATTSSVDAIKDSDVKILFGNSEQIVDFSASFIESLMFAAASVYVLPKSSRLTLPRSSFSTAGSITSNRSSRYPEAPTQLDDDKTFIGASFMDGLEKMERVYGLYLKNHDAANQRLQVLSEKPKVRIWLQECHHYAEDLTKAWDLDSLLVKPTQRILKYPLILDSLVKETPQTHPDYPKLFAAAEELKKISSRINDSKKRSELMQEMESRKKKESEGLLPSSIARKFGRRTEKLKQQVGMVEMIDDKEYDALNQRFGGHIFSLQIVMRDIEKYMQDTRQYMVRFLQLTQLLETYLILRLDTDKVERSDADPVLESKWRKTNLALRELTQIALPDHLNEIQKLVLDPIIKLWNLHAKPQKMMMNRKDHLPEYIKYRSTLERGDKLDKKTRAAGEQWIALNETLKDELPKIYSATKELISTVTVRFMHSQMKWQKTMQKKFHTVTEWRGKTNHMENDLTSIAQDFKSDFQIIANQVQQIGLCNGSTLNEIKDFFSANSFDGGFSPKRPSTMTSKRTESMGSETFEAAALPGFHSRDDQFGFPSFSFDQGSRNSDSSPNRTRANSNISSRGAQTPYSMNASVSASASASVSGYPPQPPYQTRPSTSNSRSAEPSPSFPQRPDMQTRPSYASSREGPPSISSHRFSGLFSSALPMSDSPGVTRPTSPERTQTPPKVLFLAASLFEFNIANDRREAGYPYLRYVQGEIFDILGQKGELWLARNQDDSSGQVGWIWEKHFAPLSES